MALSSSYASIVSKGVHQQAVTLPPPPQQPRQWQLEPNDLLNKKANEDHGSSDGGVATAREQQENHFLSVASTRPSPRRQRPEKPRKPHHRQHVCTPLSPLISVAGYSDDHMNRGGDHRPSRHGAALSLQEILRETMGCVETPERNLLRQRALLYVDSLLQDWAQNLTVTKKSNGPTAAVRTASSAARASWTGSRNATATTSATATASMTANTTDLQPNEGTTVEEQPHVTLIPFGSYRLGVHRPNSDLDCLVLTSAEVVKRVDFFSSWVELLRSDPNISHVHPIPNAFTPVLKFLYRPTESVSGDGDDAVQLDLLFARVRDASRLSEFLSHRKHALQSPQPKLAAPFWTSPSYTEYYWIDDHDLPDQDAAGIRSINGCRVTQIILQLIAGYDGAGGRANAERMLPDNLSEGGYVSRMRLQRYQEVLCIIKQWAINAGIYSNALGFLGGVNWAILVAWICLTSQEFLEPQRLQSDAIVSILLRRFFVVFDRWKWPAPVMLTPIQLAPPKEFAFGSVHPSTATSAVKSLNAELQPWNPAVVKRDRFHIMPILTPAWPAMNSAYNVGVPQLRRMRDEFSRSRERLVSVRNHDVLPALFDLGNFFDRHKHFLVITMTTARTETADVHKQWCQYLESKLRLLLVSLDTTEIHPWPYSKFFHDHGEQVYRTYFIMALRFAPQVSNVNLQPLTSDWLQRINSWSGRTASLDLKLEHTVDVNLPLCVREEIVNSGRLVGQLRQLTPAKSTASGGGGGDCDSDDNGSRASDRSYVSVASSFSSVVHQQTKRSRGSDGGAVEGNK